MEFRAWMINLFHYYLQLIIHALIPMLVYVILVGKKGPGKRIKPMASFTKEISMWLAKAYWKPMGV